jgi:4-hydroxythreonine-4-phosphate dehydrogenase
MVYLSNLKNLIILEKRKTDQLMDKLKIGISIGDINGIGLEVILKTISNKQLLNLCVPVVYGSTKVVSYNKNIVEAEFPFHVARSAEHLDMAQVNIINCWQENVNITLGKPTEEGGAFAKRSLEAATQDLKAGLIDALVTAPINKNAMQLANFEFPGHTEYLTHQLGGKSLMLMIHDELRIGLATNHLPLKEVAASISKDLILKKIRTLETTLKVDFGLEKPTIAVLGLNPHAGDGGVLGDEELKIIKPAIMEAKEKGIMAMGPFPADAFFGSGQFRKFDAILAMYHDQGLVPFKTLSFGNGVNFTAGLSAVRTSPDHGTAYDIAGKNEANPDSFRSALYAAIDITRSRRRYQEWHANPLERRNLAGVTEDEEILEEDKS